MPDIASDEHVDQEAEVQVANLLHDQPLRKVLHCWLVDALPEMAVQLEVMVP